MFGYASEQMEELRLMRGDILDLTGRVEKLEARMSETENDVKEAVECSRKAAENSETIIDIVNGAKGVAGFFAKHGPRIIAFGVGLMSAAGLGNPQVMAFLASFFG